MSSPASQLSVVGILWGEHDRFALVEDGGGSSFILREGDRRGDYTVTRVNPDGVVLYVSEFGVGKTIRLALAPQEKGKEHGRGEQ
jgi:hypothetical protein